MEKLNPGTALKGKKILVVEDDDDLRDLLNENLKFYGADVQLARSGREALSVSEGTIFDLILSGIRMAGGDGVFLLDGVRKRDSKKPPLIFLTAYADITAAQAYARGAQGYLEKPFDPPQLAKVLIEALKKAEG